MKIEKVNENQIRCTLTREDLDSRKIKISELAYGTEKAKNLFRDMMRQANFEFGFEAEDIPLMIEAIPLNAECIVLIITKVEDPEELDTRFSRFAPQVTEDMDEEYDDDDDNIPYNDYVPEEVSNLFRRLQSDYQSDNASDGNHPFSAETDERRQTRIFVMDSLPQVMTCARVTGSHYTGLSTLYKEERTGKYLLVLTRWDASREDFDRISNILTEYGRLQRRTVGLSYLEEHCEPIVSGNALQALAL